MLNEDVVKRFFNYYHNHDFHGMHKCLDENIKFSDFAFDIQGKEARAMWHWFCINYPPREAPVDIIEFKNISSDGDVVLAEYRVSYLYGDQQRPVDYWINARFRLQNGKIVEQQDTFHNISQFEFATISACKPQKDDVNFLVG